MGGRVAMVAGHAASSPWLFIPEAPPVPTGHDLFGLPVGEFRAYVAGIDDGWSVFGSD